MSVQLADRQQRRKRNEARFKRERQKQARISGRKPVRDPGYLDFIRSRACLLCSKIGYPEQGSPTEAAHVGDRGLRQKCSDRKTLPLCAHHHRTGKFSHHNLQKQFWSVWNLNRDELIEWYNALYESERAA